MKTGENKDALIRKLVRQQPLEKASEGFADRVMGRIAMEGTPLHEPLFSTMTWFAIFMGAAALVTTILFMDIPWIGDIFSSSGIQQLSFNIFTKSFYESFLSILQGIHVNTTIIIILAAAVSLVVIERLLSNRRPSQGLMLF